MYKEAYGLCLSPIPDKEQWQIFDVDSLEPPTMKRSIGRPARNRRREPGEPKKGKRSIVITCKKCGCIGHNSKTCKGGYTAREKALLQGKVSKKGAKKHTLAEASTVNFPSLDDLQSSVLVSTQPTVNVEEWHDSYYNTQEMASTSSQRKSNKGKSATTSTKGKSTSTRKRRKT